MKINFNKHPEYESFAITAAEEEKVSRMKMLAAPGPDVIHTYWLNKLTALHEGLAAQTNQLLSNGTQP